MARFVKIIVVLLCLAALPYGYLLLFIIPEVNQGDAAFLKAQEEEDSSGRYLQYNRALHSYLLAEQRLPFLFKDWRLAMRTGQALFNLRQYPEALYYFLTSYRDNPSKETEAALKSVLNRLELSESLYEGRPPFFSPPEAIVLADSTLKVKPGTLVQLLEEDKENVKVRTPEGAIVYLSKNKVRVLK